MRESIILSRHDAALAARADRAPLARKRFRSLEPFCGEFLGLSLTDRCGVYAVGGINDLVKIGKAFDIAKRVKELQTGHPIALTLLAVLDPNPENERQHHAKFEEYWFDGEWFTFGPGLRQAIREARERRW